MGEGCSREGEGCSKGGDPCRSSPGRSLSCCSKGPLPDVVPVDQFHFSAADESVKPDTDRLLQENLQTSYRESSAKLVEAANNNNNNDNNIDK